MTEIGPSELFALMSMVPVLVVGGVVLVVTDIETLFTIEVPLLPAQVRVYVVVCVGYTFATPEVALGPDHPPEAVQLVAFEEDQLSAAD